MMIAPGEAGSELGTIQPQTSVHRARRVAGLYAQGETDTARTERTKHGPLGCRAGNALRGGRFRRVCFCKSNRFLVSPAAVDFPLQPSGPCFVRSVRAVSVSH